MGAARDSAGTREWARLRGDVDVLHGRLESLRVSAQRLVEDLDHLLKQPPFVKELTFGDKDEHERR